MSEYAHIASDLAVDCLRLHLIAGIGPQRFRQLIDYFGSAREVLSAPASTLERVPNIGAQTTSAIIGGRGDAAVEQELQRAGRLGATLLCCLDEAYPDLLRQIPDAPVCLYALGDLSAADGSALAVVGSRRCSYYGKQQAYQYGMQLARCGLTVVSGLALGVDAEAHRGALDCGGRSIAVLGCGLGHLRNHHHAALADRLLANGAIVSELPIDRPPEPRNFPQRNRIIAGLSLGTLVIEAARRSGALITARLASEYNREVFAVPGRAGEACADGTNRLIQNQHARLVLSVEDILTELQHASSGIRRNYDQRAERILEKATPEMTAVEHEIFDALSRDGVDLEQLCDSTQLPPEEISNGLIMLQLKGAVEQLPGNRYARVL